MGEEGREESENRCGGRGGGGEGRKKERGGKRMSKVRRKGKRVGTGKFRKENGEEEG